jgi:hypothetical protein
VDNLYPSEVFGVKFYFLKCTHCWFYWHVVLTLRVALFCALNTMHNYLLIMGCYWLVTCHQPNCDYMLFVSELIALHVQLNWKAYKILNFNCTLNFLDTRPFKRPKSLTFLNKFHGYILTTIRIVFRITSPDVSRHLLNSEITSLDSLWLVEIEFPFLRYRQQIKSVFPREKCGCLNIERRHPDWQVLLCMTYFQRINAWQCN